MKLSPMFVAPFLSRLRGAIQSRCVQRRRPLILFPLSPSSSVQAPHSPRQRQHVLLVYASGVGTTTKRRANFLISPTPMHGGFPWLQIEPAFPAINPHDPYASTSCL